MNSEFEVRFLNINKNDFNTENIIDIDNSNLNEFWWWHKIQNDLKKL